MIVSGEKQEGIGILSGLLKVHSMINYSDLSLKIRKIVDVCCWDIAKVLNIQELFYIQEETVLYHTSDIDLSLRDLNSFICCSRGPECFRLRPNYKYKYKIILKPHTFVLDINKIIQEAQSINVLYEDWHSNEQEIIIKKTKELIYEKL